MDRSKHLFARGVILFFVLMMFGVTANMSWAEDASLPVVQNPQPATTDAPTAPPADGNIVDDVIKHIENTDGAPMPPAIQISPDAESAAPAAGIPGIVAEGDNATLPAVPTPPPTYEDKKTVILHALDKVTARTQTFEVPVGQQFNFGALTIAVRACRARPALEPADAAAFLQIVEQKPGEPMIARFSGWMFASAPSLSALEHPVYDVWVVGCGDKKG